MKKITRFLLCMALLVCLTVPLLTVGAYAWDVFSEEGRGKVGESLWMVIDTPNGQQATDERISSGSMPGGLSLGLNDACVIIHGTPTQAGTFNFVLEFRTNDTDYHCNVTLTIDASSQPYYTSGTVYATQGKKLTETSVVEVEDMIQTSTRQSGSLPKGMTCTQYDTYFTVSGTPTESGTFSVKYYCETEGNPCYVTINVVVASDGSPETSPEPSPDAELKITKDPGGETVMEGESASFVSAAENYSAVEWRVVTKDGSSCWRQSKNYAEIEGKFPGVKVRTYKGSDGREWLELQNIPKTMDGYYIETKFWSLDGKTTAFTKSKACLLTVKEADLKTPVISSQPTPVEKKMGESATVYITASDPNSGTLSYQWYASTNNTNVGGTPVVGANSASLNVPQTEGTTYYYCVVTSTKDGRTSAGTASAAAAVTYKAAAAPTPTPTPTAKPSAEPSPTPGQTAVPAATPKTVDVRGQDSRKNNDGAGFLVILLILLGVLLVASVVVFIILNKKRAEEDATPLADDNSWACPACGSRNQGRFCQNCGQAKPVGALQYACDKCGWEPEDPTHPPKFCPECGDPFGDEDVIR